MKVIEVGIKGLNHKPYEQLAILFQENLANQVLVACREFNSNSVVKFCSPKSRELRGMAKALRNKIIVVPESVSDLETAVKKVGRTEALIVPQLFFDDKFARIYSTSGIVLAESKFCMVQCDRKTRIWHIVVYKMTGSGIQMWYEKYERMGKIPKNVMHPLWDVFSQINGIVRPWTAPQAV
ncbi:hypothetical protein C4569_01215 [Candidatus Parcubacteria bacterium]|nr:MAG: hypothetical protein C4569_01215 [Candidatus Parcubacteria bacterium]